MKGVRALGEGVWNLRGSFRVGPVDVGTHASLVRLASGRFVLLDAIDFTDVQRRFLAETTENGAALEAVLHLHPFHTVFVESAARRFPNARQHGTSRHRARLPSVAWEPLATEDPELHARYAGDLAFSIPRGVTFVPANENLHFASVLALHRASGALHVDDTFNMQTAPRFLRRAGGVLVTLHPTLPFVLEPRPEAVREFRGWADEVLALAADARHLAVAHDGVFSPSAGEPSVRERLARASRRGARAAGACAAPRLSLALGGSPRDEGAMSTLQPDVEAALDGLEDGATIAVGGFGLSGNPEALIEAVRRRAPKNLTLVSNNAGAMGRGLATWLEDALVAKIICTYVGTNQDLHARMAAGSIDVTIVPQGTFVERMRAAGAGLAGFYTPTGVGTVVAEGKETRDFGGRTYVLEEALPVDVALVRCRVADPFGNLRFYRTSRNFQPAMAMAAKVAIAEAETVVPLGGLDPDDVHLSGAFVQRVVHVPEHEDVIEFRTVRARPEERA